jgi:hypothetical protein
MFFFMATRSGNKNRPVISTAFALSSLLVSIIFLPVLSFCRPAHSWTHYPTTPAVVSQAQILDP